MAHAELTELVAGEVVQTPAKPPRRRSLAASLESLLGTLVEIPVDTSRATYAPTVISSAWAKLGSRMTAIVRVRPSAMSAYRLPVCRERIKESRIRETGTDADPEIAR